MRTRLLLLFLIVIFFHNDYCITKDLENTPLLPSSLSSDIKTIINVSPYNDSAFIVYSNDGHSFFSTSTGEALSDNSLIPTGYVSCIEGYHKYMGKVSHYYFYKPYLHEKIFLLNNNFNHESIILNEYGSLCIVSHKLINSDKKREYHSEYYINVIPKDYKSWLVKYKLDSIGDYSLHPILIGDTLFLEIGKNLYLYSIKDGRKIIEVIDFRKYVNNYSFNENYILYKGNLFSRADTRHISPIDMDIFDNILKLENDKIIGCSLESDCFYANIFDLNGRFSKKIKLGVPPYSFPKNTIQPTQLLGIGNNCVAYNDWSLRNIGITSFDNKLLFSFSYSQEEAGHIKAFMAGNKLIVKISGGIFSYDTDLNKIGWIKPFQDGFHLIRNEWYFYNQVDIYENRIVLNRIFESVDKDFRIEVPYFDKYNYRITSDKNSVYMFDKNPNSPNAWPIQFTADASKRKNLEMQYSWYLDYTYTLNSKQYCIMHNKKTNITKTFIQRGNRWEIDNGIPSYRGLHANNNDALVTLTENHIFIYMPRNVDSLNNLNKTRDYKKDFKIDFIFDSTPLEMFLWKSEFIVLFTQNKLVIFDYLGSEVFARASKYLAHDMKNIYLIEGDQLISFDGSKELKVALSESNKELLLNSNNKILFSSNNKLYSQFRAYDFNTNSFFQIIPEKLSRYMRGGAKVIDTNEGGFLLFPSFYFTAGDYATYGSSIIFSPCNTFSIKQQIIGGKIELTIKNTTNQSLENSLSGKVRIMPYGADGKAPIFHELEKRTYDIPPLKSGESATVSITLPEMKTLDNELNTIGTDYFALIIESNGLLDTKNSELSDFDKEGRPLFDGVPTSLEKQQAIVVTVWKK